MGKNKTKKCKYCHSEIPKKAKMCPQCGRRVKIGAVRKAAMIVIIIFAILVGIVSIISISNESETDTQDFQNEGFEQMQDDTDISETNDENEKKDTEDLEELVIEKRTLYEGHDTIVQTTGEVSESARKIDIGLYFENNSDLNLKYYIHSYAVNGIMADEQSYISGTEIPAGKRASNTLSISKSWLENSGVDKVDYIDILFWAYDNDANYKEFETDAIRIDTSLYTEDISYTYDDVIFEDGGIVVSQLSLNENTLSFAVFNKTGSYFDFGVKNASVNDWAFDTGIQLYSEEVLDGCLKICTLTIDTDFLESNGIESIENIEFSISVRTLGSYLESYSIGPMIARFQ